MFRHPQNSSSNGIFVGGSRKLASVIGLDRFGDVSLTT
jgi:hypothetical protein